MAPLGIFVAETKSYDGWIFGMKALNTGHRPSDYDRKKEMGM